MKNNKWIKKSVLLGISFFISILLVKPIGVSTQFSVASGIIHNLVNSNIISKDTSRESGYKSTNEYYDKSEGKIAEEIKNPINYSMIFVISIPLGAFIANKRSKKEKNQEEIKCEIDINNKEKCLTNNNFIKKYSSMFIGGFLLLYGARFAGGCTSGHMMSGIMQSSLSGYVFAGVVFAVAIPTAIINKKLKNI